MHFHKAIYSALLGISVLNAQLSAIAGLTLLIELVEFAISSDKRL